MFKALFDLKFNSFITPTVAGIMLVIFYLFAVLVWINYLINVYYPNFFFRLIIALIGLPISLVFIRVWFETIIALIKTAESSLKILKILEEDKTKNNGKLNLD
ncbi:DUF4282 domain-containing protein [Persephonella sp.]